MSAMPVARRHRGLALALDAVSGSGEASALDRLAQASAALGGHGPLEGLERRLRSSMAELSDLASELRSVVGFFSYFNIDPANIRNQVESGGGALMDIGCYLIHAARYGFAQEPTRVVASIDRDPKMHTDRLTSALLDFPAGHAIFTCSTQLVAHQRVHFLGTRGRIEVEIPFNAPIDRPTRLFIDDGSDLSGGGITTETFSVCNQYTAQGDAFSKAVLQNTEIPVPLEDAIKNMAIIDAIFHSADTGQWVSMP